MRAGIFPTEVARFGKSRMATIRAYKLAEELGLERNEFVEKARAVGFDLKNAMAALEEEEVEQIRAKLTGEKPKEKFVEKRVEGSKGGAVIRRRKKVEEVETKPEDVAPAVEEVPIEEPPPVAEPEPEQEVVVEPPTAAEPAAAAEAKTSAVKAKKPRVESDSEATAALRKTKKQLADQDAEQRSAKQRKRVREDAALGEQEELARESLGRFVFRHTVEVDTKAYVSPRRKRRDPLTLSKRAAPSLKPEKRICKIEGDIAVSDLAKLLGVKAPLIQGKLMGLGIMVAVNQKIDVETAARVAASYGFEVQDVGFKEEAVLQAPSVSEAGEPRPPIVTVMGHVDHGKTSLLDAIRQASVVAGESGGITQHIGAYQATVGNHKITFIDTPGHEAFTQMRARGAQVTDIVILVVAASEGPMPQTVEAINHAKAAGVPIIVAINKCDLPDADPEKTRQKLMEHDLVPEAYGGDTICVEVSALKRTGLDKLLEMVLLQSEVLELKADPALRASGIVLEAALDKARGPLATVLVQNGTLHQGDIVVAGQHYGRVRMLENEKGQRLSEAGPSTPVRVIGLSGMPAAGDACHAVENERAAKQLVDHRLDKQRADEVGAMARPMSLDALFANIGRTETLELPIVLKADVQGTAEAVKEALRKLSTESVAVKVIHTGVGGITESDVMLAKASNAIVVGFHVRPDSAARRAAESHTIDVRVYQVIYELTDAVRMAMAGLLPPTVEEVFLGRAEVRDTFVVPKVGTIAGCYITEGLARRNEHCRLIRDGVQIFDGKLASLRRFKDDVREVQTGFECGVGIEKYNDIKVGDVIEFYAIEEKPATL